MADQPTSADKAQQLFDLTRDVFFLERQSLPLVEIRQLWQIEAAQLAREWGFQYAISKDILLPASDPAASSMHRSQTHQPISHRQDPITYIRPSPLIHTSEPHTMESSIPVTQSAIQMSRSQSDGSALMPPPKYRRSNTGQRYSSMPTVVEVPVTEFSPGAYQDKIIFTAPFVSDPVQDLSTLPLQPPIQYLSMNMLQTESNYSYPKAEKGSVFSSPMSRETSITGSITGEIGMMRIQSEQGDLTLPQDSIFCSTSLSTLYNDNNTWPSSYDTVSPSSNARCFPLPTLSHDPIKITSNVSDKTEHTQTLPAPIKLAASQQRPLAPKTSEQTEVTPAPVTRLQSANSNPKIAISRSISVRTPKARLYCAECKKHPSGFKGDHELRRHMKQAHPKTQREVWVCLDTSPDQKFLSKCSKCTSRKTYNAYYNAAAHLRRVHFNPKTDGPKTKGVANRAGKGGGDWPKMEYLKENWMVEVKEVIGNSPQLSTMNTCAPDNKAYDDTLTYDPSFDNNYTEAMAMFQSSTVRYEAIRADELSTPRSMFVQQEEQICSPLEYVPFSDGDDTFVSLTSDDRYSFSSSY